MNHAFLLYILLLILPSKVIGQVKDSLTQKKKHAIFFIPTGIYGEGEEGANNLCFGFGYNLKLKEDKHFIGIRSGFICKSDKSQKGIFSDVDALYSKGFNIYLEHQYFYKKKLNYALFYATDLYFHHTRTYREEIGINSFNTYSVNRNVVGLVPKIGVYVAEGRFIFYELIVGCGVRYISSKSNNKIDHTQNLGREWSTRKIFDDGNKLAQRIIVQVKIGVNF